jgi:hypothetical protein
MSHTIPTGKIQDSKQIIYTEQAIPGRNYQPVTFGGNGNRKVSFTIPIVRRNDLSGNIFIMKQFESLRNQVQGFFNFDLAQQFKPNPRVLFQWGHTFIPQVYFVAKCDFEHDASFVNALSMPQLTEVQIELILDESPENILNKAERMFRVLASALGSVENVSAMAQHMLGNRRTR